MTDVRHLADEFHQKWLSVHPTAASSYGIPGYDHLMPDESEEAGARWRDTALQAIRAAKALDTATMSAADRVTRGCLMEAAVQEISGIDSRSIDHTVSPMPFASPGAFFAVAARTVILDPQAAADYIARLEASGLWLDQVTERLQGGAKAGRLPIASLVEQTIPWAAALLQPDAPEPLLAPRAPEGWDGTAEWEADRRRVAADVVKPALARWAAVVKDLLPRSRPDDKVGLVHIPGGEEDYARAIQTHTTLPLTAEQLHTTGLEQVERLEAQAREVGATIGLNDLDDIFDAIRKSNGATRPEEAMVAAVAAIRRAEAAAGQVFPDPLPPPCEVTPMPAVVATSGAAPHYTPPRLDGGRPGTFWFNTELPTAGTGWDLEAVAFHEAVPGHHLQLSRLQKLEDLPALQRQRSITVFSEGWGLYAEELAGEMGLYTDARSELGAITASLMRAARLVVDTGLHHYGWSRAKALEWYCLHVPLPGSFLANEIDRYLVMPGQALAYMTGKLEIMRQRAAVQERLGSAFTLPGFHAALLDHGSLPMPVMAETMAAWNPATQA